MATSVPAGWVFTASIPSWTQTTLEGDEVVVVSQQLFADAAFSVSARESESLG